MRHPRPKRKKQRRPCYERWNTKHYWAGHHLRWTWAGEDATCRVCFKPATWVWMAAPSRFGMGAACDEHVERGCCWEEADAVCAEWMPVDRSETAPPARDAKDER